MARLASSPLSLAVIELAWFAAGVLATVAAVRWLHLRAAAAAARQRVATPVALTSAPIELDARSVASALAEELANLVSGVEGSSHHLIQSAPDRRQLPVAAEALLAAVARLRTLHTKVVAVSGGRAPTTGSTHLGEIVASLRDELQQLQLGLQLKWEPPEALPAVLVAPDVVRATLLFLCAALLRVERGATHLSIEAERCFANAQPHLQVELSLEWVTEAGTPVVEVFAEPAFALDLEAASNLITSHGGEVAVSHLPGRTVRAVVRWPASTDPIATAEHDDTLPAAAATATHRYGGALVLEADPAIRTMLANELKATGRAVFACADTAAARTFLEATPDRFELLIVDHAQRLDADDELLPTIQLQVPGLKICVLGPGQPASARDWPPVHCIQKPFGVHELRRALASVLAGG